MALLKACSKSVSDLWVSIAQTGHRFASGMPGILLIYSPTYVNHSNQRFGHQVRLIGITQAARRAVNDQADYGSTSTLLISTLHYSDKGA